MRESERGKRDQNISFPVVKFENNTNRTFFFFFLKKKRPFSIRLFRFPILVQRKTKKSLRFALSLSLLPSTRARARGARHLAGGAGGREETRRRRDVKNDAFLARMSHWLYKKIKREKTKTHLDRRRRGLHVQRAVQIHARRFVLLLLHATGGVGASFRRRRRHGVVFFSFSLTRARAIRKAVFL